MAPAFGNKHAVGYGRPPVHYTDEQAIELGEKYLKWMRDEDNNPESNIVHLSEWYSEVIGMTPSIYKDLTRRECFAPYHEKAREWMGKRLMKNTKLQSSYGNRFLGIYFSEIKEHEIEMMNAKTKSELQSALTLDQMLKAAEDRKGTS